MDDAQGKDSWWLIEPLPMTDGTHAFIVRPNPYNSKTMLIEGELYCFSSKSDAIKEKHNSESVYKINGISPIFKYFGIQK